MKWIKLGKIFSPDGNYEWMNSHAMMPVVEHLYADEFRIYFSPRDKNNRSRPASLDINIHKPQEYYNLTETPLLELGQLGAFDDSGVMPTSVVLIDNKKHMFFNGWTLGSNIPFFSFNGIAKENNQGSFDKLADYPNALNRSESDPYSTFAPFVMKDGDIWRMWYVSLIRWEENNKHFYHIKYAESEDGLHWIPQNKVCIDFISDTEYAIARPIVIKDDKYRMWFSSRSLDGIDTYRIRYAESDDGINWIRHENVGIDVSASGWDSEMVCYPYVFQHLGKTYMVYNGNGYGKDGMGLAILEDKE